MVLLKKETLFQYLFLQSITCTEIMEPRPRVALSSNRLISDKKTASLIRERHLLKTVNSQSFLLLLFKKPKKSQPLKEQKFELKMTNTSYLKHQSQRSLLFPSLTKEKNQILEKLSLPICPGYIAAHSDIGILNKKPNKTMSIYNIFLSNKKSSGVASSSWLLALLGLLSLSSINISNRILSVPLINKSFTQILNEKTPGFKKKNNESLSDMKLIRTENPMTQSATDFHSPLIFSGQLNRYLTTLFINKNEEQRNLKIEYKIPLSYQLTSLNYKKQKNSDSSWPSLLLQSQQCLTKNFYLSLSSKNYYNYNNYNNSLNNIKGINLDKEFEKDKKNKEQNISGKLTSYSDKTSKFQTKNKSLSFPKISKSNFIHFDRKRSLEPNQKKIKSLFLKVFNSSFNLYQKGNIEHITKKTLSNPYQNIIKKDIKLVNDFNFLLLYQDLKIKNSFKWYWFDFSLNSSNFSGLRPWGPFNNNDRNRNTIMQNNKVVGDGSPKFIQSYYFANKISEPKISGLLPYNNLSISKNNKFLKKDSSFFKNLLEQKPNPYKNEVISLEKLFLQDSKQNKLLFESIPISEASKNRAMKTKYLTGISSNSFFYLPHSFKDYSYSRKQLKMVPKSFANRFDNIARQNLYNSINAVNIKTKISNNSDKLLNKNLKSETEHLKRNEATNFKYQWLIKDSYLKTKFKISKFDLNLLNFDRLLNKKSLKPKYPLKKQNLDSPNNSLRKARLLMDKVCYNLLLNFKIGLDDKSELNQFVINFLKSENLINQTQTPFNQFQLLETIKNSKTLKETVLLILKNKKQNSKNEILTTVIKDKNNRVAHSIFSGLRQELKKTFLILCKESLVTKDSESSFNEWKTLFDGPRSEMNQLIDTETNKKKVEKSLLLPPVLKRCSPIFAGNLSVETINSKEQNKSSNLNGSPFFVETPHPLFLDSQNLSNSFEFPLHQSKFLQLRNINNILIDDIRDGSSHFLDSDPYHLSKKRPFKYLKDNRKRNVGIEQSNYKKKGLTITYNWKTLFDNLLLNNKNLISPLDNLNVTNNGNISKGKIDEKSTLKISSDFKMSKKTSTLQSSSFWESFNNQLNKNSLLILSDSIKLITKNIKTTLSPYSAEPGVLCNQIGTRSFSLKKWGIPSIQGLNNSFLDTGNSRSFEKRFLSYLSSVKLGSQVDFGIKKNMQTKISGLGLSPHNIPIKLKNLSKQKLYSIKYPNKNGDPLSVDRNLKDSGHTPKEKVGKEYSIKQKNKAYLRNGYDSVNKNFYFRKLNKNGVTNQSFVLLLKNRLFVNKEINKDFFSSYNSNKKKGLDKSNKLGASIQRKSLKKNDTSQTNSQSEKQYGPPLEINNQIIETRRKKQHLKLKRRLKKMQCATRRRKKRKIFYPRPVWITFITYNKFLNNRFGTKKRLKKDPLSDKNSQSFKKSFIRNQQDLPNFWLTRCSQLSKNSKEQKLNPLFSINLLKTQSKILHFTDELSLSSKLKKSYNKKDSLRNTTFILVYHPDSKEFYKISRTVSQDLKRILLKSNWLRNYLNPYLEKVKSIYKDLEQDAKKTTLLKNLQSFIEAIYGSISLKEPFRFYSKDIATNGEFNSTAIQYLLKFESNRIIYQRIQTLILNIRENLNLKGQIKNRSHNLGKNVRSLIKRDYIKRDNNRASSGNQNGVVDQTNYYLSKFMKRNFYNLRRSFLFSNQGYDETSHYTNETLSPVLRNNYYWALNRLNLPVNSFSSNTTSFSKKLWEKSKIREINKTQKTKKMLFDLFLKYNSLLNHQNSLDVYNNIFLLESDIFEPENLNSTINLRSSDKKNANLVKHFVSDKNSQFFLKEKKRNLFKDQIDEKTNVVNSDIKKDNGQPGFLLNKKKIFRERSPYATPKSSLSKGETKLINIENKLKLLGSSYSTKTTQPSFYSNLKQINLDSPAQSLWGLDYGVARKNEVPQNKALHSSLVQITKRKLSPKNFFVLRSNNFLIRKSLKVKDIVKIAPLSYKKTFFRFLKQELMLGRRSAISYNDSKEIESLISSKTNIKTLSLNFQTDNQIRMFFNLKQNLFKNLAAINKINQISNFSQMSNQNAYWWTESPTNHFRLKKDSNLFYTKKSNTCSDILERDKYFLSRVFTEQSNSEINNVSSSFNTGLSVLFHFCTLITLISLGGIRNIIKFYYILISKVSNLLNKFRFLVNFSTHYNTDIVFKEKESSFKNLIKLSLKKKQESLIPYYNSKIFSNNSKGFQLKNKIKKLKIKAFGWGIKDLNRNIKSPQIRGLRHLLKTFQITKSFFFQLAKPPSALSEDNKKTSSVNKFRELSSKRLNKNKTTKYFDTMSNYSIIDFSLIQKEFRFYNKLDKEKDLSFNLKTSNFLLVQTLVNLPFITLNFGREANPLTPKKDIKMVGGFSPFIQIKSSIQSMLWVSRFIANSFFLSKIEKTRKLNSVNIGKGLSAQIERSLQEQNNIQKESSELFKNKNIYIWTSLYSLSKKNRKLLYDSNLKLSIGLMFGYKVSFYTYLLLLKSVDVLAAPAFFIYKFFEKPGEYVVENLAYSFLLEWSADLVSTVPDSIDNSISISFSKLNRNIPFYFNLPSLNSLIFHGSLTNKIQIWFESLSNVTKNSAESHTNITNSLIGFFGLGIQNSLYRRFIRSSLLLFIQQLCEPDLDSINRQQKGILFWETWGESLKSVAESNSVNIYELSTDKEEQLKLLSNLDAFWSFNQSNSLTNSQNRPNKTNSLRFNNFSYHTNFTDIVELEKDYSNERPSFVLKNSNIKKEIGNLLSNLPFHLSFSGSPKDEISSHSLIGGLRTAFNQKKKSLVS
jgi:hypothetical protein